MKIVFLFLGLVLATVNGGLLERDDEAYEADVALPTFEDDKCPTDSGLELCVKVAFPNGMEDRLLLARDSPDSKVYEGVLMGEDDASVVLIDAPEDGERIISFNSDHSFQCNMFHVDMETDEVSCTSGATLRDDEELAEESDRDLLASNLKGAIVPLGKYYKSGIPLSVLFTFDTGFVKTFGASAMDTLVKLVKNLYTHKSLKNLIGTTIKVTGTTRKYSKAFKDTGCVLGQCGKGDFPRTFQRDAPKQKAYDAYTYVQGLPANGGGGIAVGGTICKSDKGERISFTNAYGKSDCKADQVKKCTLSKRLAITAETVAHEIGHNLGMDHDFDSKTYRSTRKFVYRKYKGKSCKGGLMSYGKNRNGWSACSQRDFSRYITSGGTKKPCTFAGGSTTTTSTTSTTTGSSTSCSQACANGFKRCHNHFKDMMGCSRAYTQCRGDLDAGQMAREGCKKKCKDTKAMITLKSC